MSHMSHMSQRELRPPPPIVFLSFQKGHLKCQGEEALFIFYCSVWHVWHVWHVEKANWDCWKREETFPHSGEEAFFHCSVWHVWHVWHVEKANWDCWKKRKPSPIQERRLFLCYIVLCDTCDMCDMLKRQTEITGKKRKPALPRQ